ncbi:hypothetical protein AAG906_007135 [Vitis piasezkii]
MAPELEDFDLTGPKQLTDVDWRNNHHCRAVAASLVQGAYNSEHNRQKSQDSKVQPSRWWSSFHFEVKRVLIDNKDSSIYGVVYEFKRTNHNNLPECAPKCVIAFRGTTLKSSSAKQDMKLNIKLLTAELHKDNSHFKPALDVVKEVVQEAEPANICWDLFGWGDHLWQERHLQFDKLSDWIPNLFVNKDDPICSRYIDHFENRKIQSEIRSIGSALKAAVGMDPQLPVHLLPKAYLTISKNSSSRDVLEAHGLKQWWYQMSIGPGFASSSMKVSIGDTKLVGEP